MVLVLILDYLSRGFKVKLHGNNSLPLFIWAPEVPQAGAWGFHR